MLSLRQPKSNFASSKLNKGDNCESLKNVNNLECEEICGCGDDSLNVYLKNLFTIPIDQIDNVLLKLN